MNFLLADTFTQSLGKLSSQEQKSVKTSVFDLQVDPAHPGLQLHRLESSKDHDFWSARVSRDIRLIVHRTGESLLVCYVDHHDKAYDWAARRKIARHPKTGATQIVEVRERIEEIPIYKTVEREVEADSTLLFSEYDQADLLEYGVPEEWIADIQNATENDFYELATHLPQEAVEALLELAVGGKPEKITADVSGDGLLHPDAKRRFHLVHDEKELALALEFPWEKWSIFLHPSQDSLVKRNYRGPARASGSAGTGKTVVALHRAARLAKANPKARILLTTFSPALAELLQLKLSRLLEVSGEAYQQVTVRALNELAGEWFEEIDPDAELVNPERLREIVNHAAKQVAGHPFTDRFLNAEWRYVVDAWQITSREDYLATPRTGRKSRVSAAQREVLWEIMALVRKGLSERSLTTWPGIYATLERAGPEQFDHVIVDEAQDLSVAQLRLLTRLTKAQENGLFLAGDIGQRIFQHPFSWKALGINLQGRSHTLRVNYRTSEAIRRRADQLLQVEVRGFAGETEYRLGTVSLFNGPTPTVMILDSKDEEIVHVSETILNLLESGFAPDELGIFVRSESQLPIARAALKASGCAWSELERTRSPKAKSIALSTMHLAKGLEFRAVIIMACNDEVIPSQERIENITDQDELEEVYTTERHLLYVACTRAREQLLISATAPESEFLCDLGL